MSNTALPIIQLAFKKDWKSLADALAANPIYGSENFANASELLSFMAGSSGGLIMCSLADKDDLIQIATFMKLSKKLPKEKAFKVVVVNSSGVKQFEAAINKLGIQDILEANLTAKVLRFKMDFWMKALNAQAKKHAAALELKAKAPENNKAQAKTIDDKSFSFAPPMDCEDDIWLLQKESDCKKILGRWMVKFLGPSPYVGQWVETDKKNIWIFEFKEGTQKCFQNGSGTWHFRGDHKPDFNWKENIWFFTGDAFDLYYYDQTPVSRANLKEKILMICSNSDYAKTREQELLESCDKDLVFRKDVERLENLKGKGGPAEKNKGALSGKVEENEGDNGSGPLTGKSSTDKVDTKGMNAPGAGKVQEGKLLDMENKHHTHETHYKGHFEAEQYEAAELQKNKYSEEGKGSLSGKASTDKLDNKGKKGPASPKLQEGKLLDIENKKHTHETHYKGHFEAEEYEAAELQKNKYAQEEQGALGGKSQTDYLQKHYGGKEQEGGEAKEGTKKSGPLTGKSNTDKMASLYDNKAKPLAAQEDRKTAAAVAENLAGKSSTDKIAAHYASREKTPAQAKAQKANSDTFSFSNPNLRSSAKASRPPGEQSSDPSKVGKVLPLTKESGAATASNEDELEAITGNAKVTAYVIRDKVKLLCTLDDFFDESIIFVAPLNDLQIDEKVFLDLSFDYQGSLSRLSFDALVTSADSDEEMTYLTVSMEQQNIPDFEKFMELYQERQKNINLFLQKVKGY